ncbi:protein chain release factor B [Longilinea arvoryzae]|uniref:Protein chain release factor B n=1 Tax=Longilinea arvoryzae TaxID=360412 RepID=A0A0S7BEU6_9CHLR|nr:alternative ribosome rescue aminoacyl-tRNA hydrolase ArfB [Longilinea arvoryzae]GAP13488.1 protein chain release factor B [Longilinea arvoryzae]
MVEIIPSLQLDESELQFDFIRSAGPGGQNVNKVSTACQLRWDVRSTPALPPEVKERLMKLAGSRMTDEGVLIIEARRYRTQEQNRLDAIQRLIALVQKALEKPKERKKTRPSVTASAARVDDKKRRGAVKRTRRYNPADWED